MPAQRSKKPNDEIILGKVPPQAVDFEEAVIGAALSFENAVSPLSKILIPEHFYRNEHQLIWKAILDLYENDEPVDMLTVMHKLKLNKQLEEIGGPHKLAMLTNAVASGTNSSFHAQIILQKYLLRQIIFLSSLYANKAYDEQDPFTLITDLRAELDELDNNITALSIENAKKAADTALKNIHAAVSQKAITIYETGHDQFDELVGIAANEILLVAGPAGHGKTKFVTALMFNLLERHKNIAVDWYSFEDDSDKLIRCYLASKTGIEDKIMKNKSKKNKLTMDHLTLLASYQNTLNNFDIEFHTEAMSSTEVKNSFVRFAFKRPNKLNICIIDNLLLLTDRGKFTERDDTIMANISKMRQATKGLIIPIHHFGDEQQSTDRAKTAYRPRVKDMKGSEGYRRVPTQILLINKPGEYSDIAKMYNERPEMPYLFITDCAKNRDGATTIGDEKGIIRWYADLKLNIFHEY